MRTWDRRYGLGPEAHTGGRHRRWTARDVARLERMCAWTATGLPPAEAARLARTEEPPTAAPPGACPQVRPAPAAARSRAGSGLRLGDVRQECRGIARAALRLDAVALDRLLLTAITEHGLVAAWTEVIMPTLQAVGRKWETSGEKYVEVEHFLSWHVSGALRRSAPRRPPTGVAPPRCSRACRGDAHAAAGGAVRRADGEGVPVRMFGGALPVESLVSAVRRTGPAAVGCGPSPGPPPVGHWPSTWPPWSGACGCSPRAGRPGPRTGMGGADTGGRGAPGDLPRPSPPWRRWPPSDVSSSGSLGRGSWHRSAERGPLDQRPPLRHPSPTGRARCPVRGSARAGGAGDPARRRGRGRAPASERHRYRVDRGAT
ncbi:B12-binding domain-containing protein [Streptomyces sp. M10(2022)]